MSQGSGAALAITVNGRQHRVEVDPRSLLVDVVRSLGGTGARVGCHTGDCGSCTLRLDGRLVKSCLVLAVAVPGGEVTTIEGFADPVVACLREAFVACKGFQCGYCTSGMILAAAELLRTDPDPTEDGIRHALIGNLCRCTGYDSIVNAVADAARRLRELPG